MPIKIEGEMEWELVVEIVGLIAQSEGFQPPTNIDVISTRDARVTRWKITAENILTIVEKRLNQGLLGE